jgi:hypothetical protein
VKGYERIWKDIGKALEPKKKARTARKDQKKPRTMQGQKDKY